MNVLLVNDDGIDSPFLLPLIAAASARGHRVTVCAPATQQSAKSHSLTTSAPLMAHPRQLPGAAEAWAVEGTPVDCTRLGLQAIGPAPDVVLSGINLGYNVGLAVYVSGTVGAAREAAFRSVPALAVSAEPHTPADTLQAFSAYAVKMAERLVERGAPPLAVCNLNAPPVALSSLGKPVLCPLHKALYQDGFEQRRSPDGQLYYWKTAGLHEYPPTPGSDLDWLKKGHVTCTFLTVDGMDQERFQSYLEK